ncbi:MAG: prolyl oligopeptidase family serine peptidase [Phycisphaerales bacterium]
MSMTRRVVVFASLASLGLASLLPAAPPETPKVTVTDTYHGTAVKDDYRWLEDWNDPAVKAWSDAQNTYARSVLDKLPAVDAIRARVTQIMSAPSAAHVVLSAKGGKLFAMKRQPPKQQPFLVVMASPEKPDEARVLVDPVAIDSSGGLAIDWFVPSPDGSKVAVSLSKGGSESGDIHVFDSATGKPIGEVIERVNGGTAGGSLAWAPDGTSFYYTRYPRTGERPAEDMDFYVHVYHHRLGSSPSEDTYEVGKDFPRIAEIVIEADAFGRALVSMQKGDGGEFQHYLKADGAWTQLSVYDDRVVQAFFGPTTKDGGTVYLVSRKDAPRGKLLALPVKAGAVPKLAEAKVLVPEAKDATIVNDFFDPAICATTPTRVYLTYQLGGPSEIRAFDHQGKPQKSPEQPPIGAAGDMCPMGGEDVLFAAASYTQPFAWFHFDGTTTTKLRLTSPPPVDFTPYAVTREWAVSKDGTKVPINIIVRKGIKFDGSNPCLVTGYGGYGVNITPGFRAGIAVLLEQGFVWAQANIRGGGEFGDEWHKGGNLLNKQNVFDDFAAACRHMIEKKYTSPAKLAIEGGSNGGLLMGATFTQHPEMARAVVSHVGIYDMLRVELSPNGAFNIPEFGTVKDAAQFKAMFAYSPYHHVKEGTKYPSILFLTGANDPRVDPMQSRKMTARLQAVGAEALLRTSSNSGHGMGTALSERIEQAVDVNAFLFSRLGVEYKAVK